MFQRYLASGSYGEVYEVLQEEKELHSKRNK
jgi:hypothetical protein